MKPSPSTTNKRRSIFRPEAAEWYAQRQEAAVLPRFIAPPTFALLWIVLTTLASGLIISWFVHIPIFTEGTAVIHHANAKSDHFVLVTFLPAANLPNLDTNPMIHWHAPASGERVAHTATAVSLKALSPAKISETYPASVGAAITKPSVVLTTTLETAVLGQNPASHLGALHPVDVQIGSRRVLSLLPFVGALFLETEE